MFDIYQKLSELPECIRKPTEDRINEVHEQQRRMGMTPRTDSELTWKYAMCDIDDTSENVANELVFVDEIFKKTRYTLIEHDALRLLAHDIRRKYKLGWKDTWNIAARYGPTVLKMQCILDSNILRSAEHSLEA